jgi:hypothetical protein
MENEAIDAARSAFAVMDGGQPAVPAANTVNPKIAPGSAPARGFAEASAGPVSGSRSEPAWVSSPYDVYDQRIYVAAVGYGSNRAAAERNAFAALTAVFGQSIQAEFSNLTNYSEAVNNGSIDVSENNAVREAVKTSSEMDSLVGAEIAGVWQNSAGKDWYAAAVLKKESAMSLYSSLVQDNLRLINEITNIPDPEKNSLEAFSRYQLAATVADANELYSNLLSVLGGASAGSKLTDIKKGGDYRLEAAKIARNIPIAVKVDGDMQNRIGNAFAVAIGRIGFKSGGNKNRYVLNVAVNLEDANLPGNQFQFCRYNIDAYLTDTVNESRLAPYNITGREGHTAMREAEIRAVSSAAKKIEAEYERVFYNFFSTNFLK